MRYLTPILVVVLLISVIANGVMWLKFRSGRSILTVNNTNLSKHDLDSYLEALYGTDFKAVFVRRALIHDAAAKAGMAPTEDDVNERFQEAKQLNWQYATTMNNNPWLADEGRKSMREQLEFNRVRAKDVTVTDDEIRDEYKLRPAMYDTPNKAEAEVALLKSGVHTDDILKLIGTGGNGPNDPMVKPAAIMSTYRGEVRFLGENNVYTFVQHFGTPEQSLVFGMKPGETKQVPANSIPPEFRQLGFGGMVVRLIRIIPGHKADLEDPKLAATDPREKDYKRTSELLKLTVALNRANPAPEILRNLFQNAKVEAEDPQDIENIKLKLFPPEETGVQPNAQKSTK